MRTSFYPVVFKMRNGDIDVHPVSTRRAAETRMKRLQINPNVVKVGILELGEYLYSHIIETLRKEGW